MRVIVSFIVSTALLACAAPADTSTGAKQGKIETITVEALQKRLKSEGTKPLIVDVREPHEYEAVHIDGARLAPLGKVESQLGDVEKSREIVLVCRSGRRSGKAYELLAARGFTNLRNVEGGMIAWEKNGYPVVKK